MAYNTKLNNLLWDIPIDKRNELSKRLSEDPVKIMRENSSLFVKALNSLTWYELVEIFGISELDHLLTDNTINKVFPAKRREYYKNARRLLSEYTLSNPG